MEGGVLEDCVRKEKKTKRSPLSAGCRDVNLPSDNPQTVWARGAKGKARQRERVVGQLPGGVAAGRKGVCLPEGTVGRVIFCPYDRRRRAF